MNFSVDIMFGEEGKMLFFVLRELNFLLLIIFIIVWIELEYVVVLVKVGVVDYILKLWDDVKLIIIVNNLIVFGEVLVIY